MIITHSKKHQKKNDVKGKCVMYSTHKNNFVQIEQNL